jgi:hypothetical protein
MTAGIRRLIGITLFAFAVAASRGPVTAADLDVKAISIQLPAEIKWVKGNGSETATLVGDPSKPGSTWCCRNGCRTTTAGRTFIPTIASSPCCPVWWVNTGPKYDPDGMKPVPAGSFVTHFGKEIHYDGAKDVECVLQIVGIGPATGTAAEQR